MLATYDLWSRWPGRSLFAATIAGLALAAGTAEADELVLKDGRRLIGEVREEARVLYVGGKFGEARVSRSSVVRWIRTEVEMRKASQKLERLSDNGTADQLYRLGVEARRRRRHELAKRAFRAAIKKDTGHLGARAALGHRKQDGQWLAKDDWHRAQGHVLYRGEWMTPAQRDHHKAELRRRLADRRRREEQARAERRLAMIRRHEANAERRRLEREARREGRGRAAERAHQRALARIRQGTRDRAVTSGVVTNGVFAIRRGRAIGQNSTVVLGARRRRGGRFIRGRRWSDRRGRSDRGRGRSRSRRGCR